MKQPTTYLMTSSIEGSLYCGVTSNLTQRIHQHKHGLYKGFTSKYGLDKLVWYEYSETMAQAIAREKQIKSWKRIKKIELIESLNPSWGDLSWDWF